MEEHARQAFLIEVERQAKFALIAINDLNIALSPTAGNDGVDRVWYSIQGLLVAAGNVSKLLWPSKKECAARGEELRALLDVENGSALEPRTFRNHFEHFDERLEAWASESRRKNFVDSNIGPAGMISGIDPADFLRNLDTASMSVTFRGDSYRLQHIADELVRLYRAVIQVRSN